MVIVAMSIPTLLLMLGNFRTTVERDLVENLNKTQINSPVQSNDSKQEKWDRISSRLCQHSLTVMQIFLK